MKNYEVYSSAYLASALAQQQLSQEKMNLEYEQQRKSFEEIVDDLNRQKIELIRQLRSFADTGSVSTRTSPRKLTETEIGPDIKRGDELVGTFRSALGGSSKLRPDSDLQAVAGSLLVDGKAGKAVTTIADNARKQGSKAQAIATFQYALGQAREGILPAEVSKAVAASILAYNNKFSDKPEYAISPTDLQTPQREINVEGGTSTEVRTTMRDPRALARLTEELDLVQSELETYRGKLMDLTPEQAELRLGRGNPYLQPLQNLREYRQMRSQARSQAERLRSMTDKEKAFYSAIRRHQAGETADQDYTQLIPALLTQRGEGVDFNTLFDTIETLKTDDEDINDIMLAYVAELAKQQPKNVDISQQVQAEEQAEAKAEDEGARIQQLLDRLREVDLRPQFMRGGVPQPRLPGVEGEPELTLREARQMDRNAAREKRRIDRAAKGIPLPPGFDEMTPEQKADFLYEYGGYEFMGRGPGSEGSTETVLGTSETQERMRSIARSARDEARDG